MTPILPLIKRIARNAREKNIAGRFEKFFLFNVCKRIFAIPALDVAEVKMPGTLINIPEASDIIEGVVNIRGNIIPQVNLRDRLGLTKMIDKTIETRMICFKLTDNSYVGMLADSIEYRLKDGVVEPLPVAIDEKSERPVKTAVIEDEKYPVFMVDNWLEENEVKLLQKIVETF
jgi:purine-binding chemotaxis protein CheW